MRLCAARCTVGVLLLLLLPGIPTLLHAQYTYTTNAGAIIITGYSGSGGAAVIPSAITGLPVTGVAAAAFAGNLSLTSLIIPDSVLSLGNAAFSGCANLMSVTLGNGLTNIPDGAFFSCTSLASIIIPNNVRTIGQAAFDTCSNLRTVILGNSVGNVGGSAFGSCVNLTNVSLGRSLTNFGGMVFYGCSRLGSLTIPETLRSVGDYAFSSCASLASLYFHGNAPTLGTSVFIGTTNALVYFLPGTAGWGAVLEERPTALWRPRIRTDTGFGLQTNRFGFKIAWAGNRVVVVEARTNLFTGVWSPVGTNTLVDGTSYFSDPSGTNSPRRFYRVQFP